MNKTEADIIEEYKRLDRLCSDMFGLAEGGVSEYIKAMEEAPEKLSANIETWQGDYKKLKHLRWVRNKIAHEIDFDEYTDEDLEDIKYYYLRVTKGTDSLSLLEKVKKKQKSASAKVKTTIITEGKSKSETKKENQAKSDEKQNIGNNRKSSAPLTMVGFFLIFASVISALILIFVLINK